MMNRYARIQDGLVAEFFSTDGDIATMFAPGLQWVAAPASVQVGWSCAAGAFTAPAQSTPALADYKKAAIARIYGDVDGVYDAVIGKRAPEYQAAEKDANAFKAAGYLGPVPTNVQSWATPQGWTPQQACDDILTTASTWQRVLESMRANRLARKREVDVAATLAAVDAALSAWDPYIAGMRSNLGI